MTTLCAKLRKEKTVECLSDCGSCQFVCGNEACFNSENCAIAFQNACYPNNHRHTWKCVASKPPPENGKHFYTIQPSKIFTDHRPLTGKNIKKEKLLYEFAKINHLNFEIEYIQDNQHFLADFLSRSPTSLMATKKKTKAQRLDQQEKTEIQKIKKAHLKKQKQLLKESETQKSLTTALFVNNLKSYHKKLAKPKQEKSEHIDRSKYFVQILQAHIIKKREKSGHSSNRQKV